jgi:hypothetical protein
VCCTDCTKGVSGSLPWRWFVWSLQSTGSRRPHTPAEICVMLAVSTIYTASTRINSDKMHRRALDHMKTRKTRAWMHGARFCANRVMHCGTVTSEQACLGPGSSPNDSAAGIDIYVRTREIKSLPAKARVEYRAADHARCLPTP